MEAECVSARSPRLVWDFRTGDVVDVETGVVVDRIYVLQLPKLDTNTTQVGLRRFRGPRLSKETEVWLRISREVRRSGKDLSISVEGLREFISSGGSRRVRTLEKPLPARPEPLVDKVVREVLPKYPRLNCRTLRVKYLIGSILTLMVGGKGINAEELAAKYGTSKAYVLKVLRKLRKLPYLTQVLKEVEEVVRV